MTTITYLRPLQQTPTSTAIALQRLGLQIFQEPTAELINTVVSEINERRVKIHFPDFWPRHSVQQYRGHIQSHLNDDALSFVINAVRERCTGRNLHWIEEINLFRLYGLVRFKSSMDPHKFILENGPKELAFPLLSACNSLIIQQPDNNRLVINTVTRLLENQLSRQHAEFTIRYYGGIENTFNDLGAYVGTPRESTIPVTLSALLSTFAISKSQSDFVFGTVIDRLPAKLRQAIHKRGSIEKQAKK